jgi:hypothetical protein
MLPIVYVIYKSFFSHANLPYSTMIGVLDDNSLGKFTNLDNEWSCLDASVKDIHN